MENWIHEVVSKWQSQQVELNPPASAADLKKAESIMEFKFPEGFKDLYAVFNGFKNWGWQEHFFSLWPLEKIVEEYIISEDKSYIVFCDYMMYCYSVGFMKDTAGIFKSYGIQTELMAESFEGFVFLMNNGPEPAY